MWATCQETALSDSTQLFKRRDFCPLQPTQFLTVSEATMQDQEKCKEKTFHGYKKVGNTNGN